MRFRENSVKMARDAGWIWEIEDKSPTLISRVKNKENVIQYTLFSSQEIVFSFFKMKPLIG